MKYFLMHKELAVAQLELDAATGNISKLDEVFLPAHLPLATTIKGRADRAALNAWWIDRSIPASRSGIREALDTLQIPDTKILLAKCWGLSLSDQYWIKPADSRVTWRQVNFFENPFSEDIGDVLFGERIRKNNMDFQSPDNTSDGCLKKRWKIVDGKRILIKGGSNPFQQQPFNEVVASKIMELLDIPHVPYKVLHIEGTPYSACEDFVTPGTELVSAWRIMKSQKQNNSHSTYQHYVKCCEDFGVNIRHSLDQMLVLDYIIANEDRHQNNFGLIRNADTLEWIGAAPIFDSGSSLGYDKLAAQILSGKNVECKPFKRTHEEQIRLVSSFDWISFDRLVGIEDTIREIFSQAAYVGSDRIDAITTTVRQRISQLEELARSRQPVIDNARDDIVCDPHNSVPRQPMADRFAAAKAQAERHNSVRSTPDHPNHDPER